MVTPVTDQELEDRRYQYYLGLIAQVMALLAARTPERVPLPEAAAAWEMLDRYERGFSARTLALAQALASASLSVRQFHDQMADEIRYLHVVAGAIARGRMSALTPADVRLINDAIRNQMRYLDNWTRAMEDPTPTHVAQLASRAAMYGGAGRSTLSMVYAAALGLPELPFHPAQGTQCLTNCGCRWDIRKLDGDGNWDCYWVRAKDDSCETCLAREAACSPLRIRNGIIQPFNATGTLT